MPGTINATSWHTRRAEDVPGSLKTDASRGLTDAEARRRLAEHGPNRIRSAEELPWPRLLLRQFTDPLILILLVAAAVSLLTAEYVDAAVILAVVVINGAIGFAQEYRARKAIHALSEMSAPKARVVRDGAEREIATEEVVPGDLVMLTAGARIPADIRLIDVRELAADESALTGESEPVAKQVEPVEDEHAVPGDQLSIAFSGTSVTRGQGRGIAVRTGAASELGRIAEETREAGEVSTPIQKKLERLGRLIGVAVVVLAVLVVAGGLAVGMELDALIRTAIALAVAAVPEALPIVVTITFAVGVRRMAARNAIIRSLPAVETLGSTTIVGADKTGTLTKNEMTVRAVWSGGERRDVGDDGYDREISEAIRLTLLAGVLANEAEHLPGDGDAAGAAGGEREAARAAGDPTELALLVAAAKAGLDPDAVRADHTQLAVIPFESAKQFMATLNETPAGRRIFLKGSPEAVLERCGSRCAPDGTEQPLRAEELHGVAGQLADDGFRVLAMAFRGTDADAFEEASDGGDPGTGFTFAGFQCMEDPVRPEAVEAVAAARRAGIRVVMLTGDHASTARAIGRQLGLSSRGPEEDVRVREGRDLHDLSDDELDRIIRNTDVYARVSPEHKLKLVERLEAQGHIVSVTGDGVNDAPALQTAHLGIAMGRAGTDVAREASDMVLADDNFASITNAVEEGRIVFANIRKVTYFLLSTAAALVIAILSSLVGPWPLPFLPVQVLWINLVTTGLQDVSLALEPGEPGLLDRPPREPDEQVLTRPVLWRTFWLGLWMAAATLGVFWWMLQQDASPALVHSVALTQMVVLQFFHVFNCRSFTRSIFRMPLLGNPYAFGSVAVALLAHLSILHVPWLRRLFGTAPLPLELWGVVVAVAFSIIIVAELDKAFLRRRVRRGNRRFKAMILDMDGVVTRTAHLHARAWKRMFDEFLAERGAAGGKEQAPFDANMDYRRYVDGKPRYDGVASFLESRAIELPWGDPEDEPGSDTICALGNRKNEMFHELLESAGAHAFADAVEQVRRWRSLGMRTALISSSRNAPAILESAGVHDLFEVTIDGTEAARLGLRGKPEPDIFVEAARRLGVRPRDAVVLEDAVAGVEAGRRGGFGLVVGVARSGGAHGLREAGADVVVSDLRDLPDSRLHGAAGLHG